MKCLLCPKQRYKLPNSTITPKYCFDHLIQNAKQKIKENKVKKKKELKEMKIRVKETPKELGKKAWTKFAKWLKVTRIDFQGYARCYTCERVFESKELQAGHCFHRGRQSYKALDFDENHIRLQCEGCNGFSAGQTNIFQAKLVKELGKKEVDKMIWRRENEPPLTVQELKNLIIKYKL